MYIQPYEPQEVPFTPSTRPAYGAGTSCTAPDASFGDDGVATMLPWTEGDAAGALNDGPFGSLGLAGMLSNLTGMMSQLAQMMQSLLGRIGGDAGDASHCGSGGCTQGRVPMRED